MHELAIQPTEEEWTELKDAGVKLDGFMEQITNANMLSEEVYSDKREIENDLYNYIEECRDNGWEIDLDITQKYKKLRKDLEQNEAVSEFNISMIKQMRSCLIDITVVPVLRKCYLYGILIAYKDQPFVQAVNLTTTAVEESTEYNYQMIADRVGIIAEALIERYKQFTDSDDVSVDLNKARKFAEHEGLRTRYVTDKLRWNQRGLPCIVRHP